MSVKGARKAQEYTLEIGRAIKRATCPLTFKFGDGERKSIGNLSVRLPLPNETHIARNAHVVDTDIPFLNGIEILKREG